MMLVNAIFGPDSLDRGAFYWKSLIIFFLLFYSPSVVAGECSHRYSASKAQVISVSRFGTILLSDNRVVRLAHLLLPEIPIGASDNWPARKSSLNIIRKMLVGKNVVLHLSDLRSDRYGFWPAYIYLVENGTKLWVQKKLVQDGVMQVSPLGRHLECLHFLLKAERSAREKRVGLWGNATYQVRSAKDVWGLLRLVDFFQLVQGKVHHVAEVKGRVYLNFGRDWRRDFTVKIPRRSWRLFRDRGLKPEFYKGKTVLVRGWISPRNGPLIEVGHPDLLEVFEEQK